MKKLSEHFLHLVICPLVGGGIITIWYLYVFKYSIDILKYILKLKWLNIDTTKFGPIQPYQYRVFISSVLASLVLVWALKKCNIEEYIDRVIFVALFGIFTGILSNTWYNFSGIHTIILIIILLVNSFVSWLLVGLLFALLIKSLFKKKL